MSEQVPPEPSHPTRRRRSRPNALLTLLIALPLFAGVTFGTVWILQRVMEEGESPPPADRETSPPEAVEDTERTDDSDVTETPALAERPQTRQADELADEDLQAMREEAAAVFTPIDDLPALEEDEEEGPTYGQIAADERLWPEVLVLTEPHTLAVRSNGRKIASQTYDEGTRLQVVRILPHGFLMVRVEENQFVIPAFKTNLDFLPDPEADAAHADESIEVARAEPSDFARVILADPDAPDAERKKEELARNAVREYLTQEVAAWARQQLGAREVRMENGFLVVRLGAVSYEEPEGLPFVARQISRKYVEQAQQWGLDTNYALCKILAQEGDLTVATGSYRGAIIETAEE